MREIKYRNIIKYVNGAIYLEYTSVDDVEMEDSWEGERKYKLIDRNLFTGLKDKNGKEIYEGDIIKGLTWKEPYAKRHSKECIGQVIYTNDYGFCFSTKGINGEYRGLPDGYKTYPSLTRSEIIGNIYENPELLEPNK